MKNNAKMIEYQCKTCKWPVISTLCNDGMMTTPPYSEWDWWMYCSNKTCEHHQGEGYFQDTPDFIESKRDD